MIENETIARIGAAGWKKPLWRGQFYPPGLPQRRELEYVTDRLSSLELNATFHALPRPSTYLDWHAQTPEGFVFAVKGHKVVTHNHGLRKAAADVTDFLASGLLGLREKLGPVLWQLPPTLAFDRDTVEAFFTALPHSVYEAQQLIRHTGVGEMDSVAADAPDRPIRHAIEVRHPSFSTPDFVDQLHRHGVAAVVTNSSEWPTLPASTADFVYVRLQGKANPEGYDDATLDGWAKRVKGWLSGENSADGTGRDVFAYFIDRDGTRPPFDAMRLRARLDGPDDSAADRTIQAPLWEE